MDSTLVLLYIGKLALLSSLGAGYCELLLPFFAARGRTVRRQAFGLGMVTVAVFGTMLALVTREESFER